MKEYTYIEFNRKVEKENLEVFSKSQIDSFSKDFLDKKDGLDDFEKSCAEADYKSLTPCVVVNEDLTKSIFYYRESQKESIQVPDGIFKSINDNMCFRFKETPLNIFKGIAGINCADKDALEKAKALPVGTEKTYGGKLYIKTSKGWRLKPKGTKGSNKVEEKEDVKNTLDKFEEQYKKNSSPKSVVSAEEMKRLSNKNINDVTRESATKTMEALEKEKKDRENKKNNDNSKSSSSLPGIEEAKNNISLKEYSNRSYHDNQMKKTLQSLISLGFEDKQKRIDAEGTYYYGYIKPLDNGKILFYEPNSNIISVMKQLIGTKGKNKGKFKEWFGEGSEFEIKSSKGNIDKLKNFVEQTISNNK